MSWTAMLNYTAGHGLPFAFWWKRRFGEDRPSTEITFGIGTDLVRNDWYTNWFTHGIKLFFAGWPVRSHCGWNVPFGTIFTLYGSACRRTNRLRMSYVPPADQTQLHTHTHTVCACVRLLQRHVPGGDSRWTYVCSPRLLSCFSTHSRRILFRLFKSAWQGAVVVSWFGLVVRR